MATRHHNRIPYAALAAMLAALAIGSMPVAVLFALQARTEALK